jgi:hypothetical protein
VATGYEIRGYESGYVHAVCACTGCLRRGSLLTAFAGRLFVHFALFACLSAGAAADTLSVGSPVSGTTLTIKDSALTALNSGWANGVGAYIDPYHGTLDGQSVLLFCIDPNHLDNTSAAGYSVIISPNGSGTNTLQTLNLSNTGVMPSSGTLSDAALAAGFSTASQLYGGLAWLSVRLGQSTDALTQQELQAAIWQLGDYTSTFAVVNAPMNFDSTAVKTLENQAKANALASGFEVVTDLNELENGKNAAQEYIVLTPEPNSAVLALSGVIGVLFLRRQKMARACFRTRLA